MKKLHKINHEESFVNWIDLLPFPLASILWSYHTQCQTPKEKYEKLLHFFEALAEFLAIIHLSIHIKNGPSIGWEESRSAINQQLQKNRLSIEKATFGTWKTIYEILAKKTRNISNTKEDQELVLNLYKTKNLKQILSLSDKAYVTIFTDAIGVRNTWLAHAGSIGKGKAEEIHQKLLELLAKIRSIFTSIWEDYLLILPENFRFTGSWHEYEAREIMGTRTPFERVQLKVKYPLVDGRLHLINLDTNDAIELIPLVQVMPGPKTELDACYFYSRFERDSGDARLISYHYEGEPDFSICDESIIATMEYFEKNGEIASKSHK